MLTLYLQVLFCPQVFRKPKPVVELPEYMHINTNLSIPIKYCKHAFAL